MYKLDPLPIKMVCLSHNLNTFPHCLGEIWRAQVLIYFQIITGIALQDATSSAARVADSSKVDVVIEDMSCEAWVEKTLDVVAWLGFCWPQQDRKVQKRIEKVIYYYFWNWILLLCILLMGCIFQSCIHFCLMLLQYSIVYLFFFGGVITVFQDMFLSEIPRCHDIPRCRWGHRMSQIGGFPEWQFHKMNMMMNIAGWKRVLIFQTTPCAIR